MQVTDPQVLAALQRHRQFSGLPETSLTELARIGQLRVMQAGERVFQVGQPNDGVYFLIDGQVRVFLLNGQGEHDLGLLGPHEVLGDLAVMAPAKHVANVTVTQPTRFVYFPLTALQQLSREKPNATSQLVFRLMRKFAVATRAVSIETLFG